MIQKFTYGNPFDTEAVVDTFSAETGALPFGNISSENGFSFTYEMDAADIVYGLGEAMHGINKRGHLYTSECADIPEHTEDMTAMYAAHNFLVISGKENFGLFLDYPAKMTFDIGYTSPNTLSITCENADLDIYVITPSAPAAEGNAAAPGNTDRKVSTAVSPAYDIVKQFRKIIGRSYIPPKFAFGFGQSRWGYTTPEDFRNVVKGYRENHIPMDMVYMDIDYMDHYKDFTVNPENFPDFKGFVDEMKARNIHLVPIIDAGVKIEKGYDIYEEGVENNYFCKREDGSDFAATVWPGRTHFPDVLNKDAREWFGNHYDFLLSQGIDGFWNDMNEPSIFYSDEGIQDYKDFLQMYLNDTEGKIPSFALQWKAGHLANNADDYKRFYHNVNGKMVRHDKVHNLFGYNMTRAAGEAFERLSPDKRILMFSRSSYIGMHRYGGIWTGDNKSWWAHILLNLKMMPSLNMCGFLYSGADLGGFGSNTTRDLLLRWLALGIFTPLMRNHSATMTREQECYQFENIEDFRHVIGVRYRLIPYIYSEFMKAALNDEMYFRPLAFDYPDDTMALRTEDQLMVGGEIMIAPVYTQNADGRFVYLPEEMMFVKFLPDGNISTEILEKGIHFVNIALNEVSLFIKKGKCIPVVDAAEHVDAIDMRTLQYIGYENADYDLYEDDGISRI